VTGAGTGSGVVGSPAATLERQVRPIGAAGPTSEAIDTLDRPSGSRQSWRSSIRAAKNRRQGDLPEMIGRLTAKGRRPPARRSCVPRVSHEPSTANGTSVTKKRQVIPDWKRIPEPHVFRKKDR